MDYIVSLLIQISLYSILGITLNLLLGYTGLLSLCHAGFYGIGAYCTAILTEQYHISWLSSLAISIFIVFMFSSFIGLASIKFKDDFFIIATFAFQILIFNIIKNSVGLTGGQVGISNIPFPIIAGLVINTQLKFLILSLFFLVIAFYASHRISRSTFGLVLLAIKEDELYTRSLGIKTDFYKISIFVFSAVIASIAGNLMAPFYTFIEPESFTINESIFILTIVIVGGLKNIYGSIIGAVFLILLPEILGFINISSDYIANLKEIIYGIILIGLLIWRPKLNWIRLKYKIIHNARVPKSK